MKKDKIHVNYYHLPFWVTVDKKAKTIYAQFDFFAAKSAADIKWVNRGRYLRVSKAICDPNDEWDEQFGTRLALGRAYIEYLKGLRDAVRNIFHLNVFPSFFTDVTLYSNNSLEFLNGFKRSLINRLTSEIEYHKAKLVVFYAKKYGEENVPRSLWAKEDKGVLIKSIDKKEEDFEEYGPLGND